MNDKTITINPNLFTMGARKNKRTEIPLKLSGPSKPTNLKKELINKIKSYHKKTQKRRSYPIDDKFNSEFKESIDYLRNVIDNENMKKSVDYDKSGDILNDKDLPNTSNHSNHSNHSNNTSNHSKFQLNIPSTISPTLTSTTTATPATPATTSNEYPKYPNDGNDKEKEKEKDVPWGILKGGNKPTYRNWMRSQTIKNKRPVDHTLTNNYIEKSNLQSPIICNDRDNVDNISIVSKNTTDSKIHKGPKRLKKKTIKKKYTCGKSKTKKQIGVIIKSMITKNKVLKEQRDIRMESIQNIKNYLYKKSFIKVGSTAPDKVLRDMYESIILTGIVTNVNSDILIHNYMNDLK